MGERLTKKAHHYCAEDIDNEYAFADRDTNVEVLVDKLGQLEDIEEELGCPLDVVFTAMKDGIYYSYDKYDYGWFSLNDEYNEDIPKGRIIFDDAPKLRIPNGIDWVFVGKIKNQPNVICCFVKDYKKTWWLRKDKSE